MKTESTIITTDAITMETIASNNAASSANKPSVVNGGNVASVVINTPLPRTHNPSSNSRLGCRSDYEFFPVTPDGALKRERWVAGLNAGIQSNRNIPQWANRSTVHQGRCCSGRSRRPPPCVFLLRQPPRCQSTFCQYRNRQQNRTHIFNRTRSDFCIQRYP